jgi:NTE family protein
VRPVQRGGLVLVDGAAVNPLPFDQLRNKADVVIGVDVTASTNGGRGVPDPWEALAATMAVIGHGIVSRKMAEAAPDLLLRPNVGSFRLFDFARASAIMRAADPLKAGLKGHLKDLGVV